MAPSEFRELGFIFIRESSVFLSCLLELLLIFQEPEDEVFLAIAKAMEEMVEDSVDCYWITRCFVNQLNSKYRDTLPQLVRGDVMAVVGWG